MFSILLSCCGCKKNPKTELESSVITEIEYVYEEVAPEDADNSSQNNPGSSSSRVNRPTNNKPDTNTSEGGNADEETVVNYTVKGTPVAYISTNSGSYRLSKMSENDLKVRNNNGKITGDLVLEIDSKATMHTIEGFGGSLTDTTCANLSKMSEANRNGVMKAFFDKKDGIGLNYLRQPCGVTDYAVKWQTYDDMPQGQTDPTLAHFSIDSDRDYILPCVKQALSLNPDIRVISSVWSPPLWMKTEYEWTSKNGAKLDPKYYDVFSQYLIKYIKAYEAEGIPIYSMVPQNEPTGKHGIPAAYYTADDMANLINNHLAPAFKNAGIKSQIWSWDFNFFRNDVTNFTKKAINNVQGIAMHYPSSEIELITDLKYRFNLPVYLTETGGSQRFDDLCFQASTLMKWLKAGASTIIRWNLVLDEYGGPSDSRNPHLWSKPNEVGDGPIGYNSVTDVTTRLADYYVLGHFSKFIERGAKVLYCDDPDLNNDFLQCFAAKNIDGSVVVLLTNQRPKTLDASIVYGNSVIKFKISQNSVITVKFQG